MSNYFDLPYWEIVDCVDKSICSSWIDPKISKNILKDSSIQWHKYATLRDNLTQENYRAVLLNFINFLEGVSLFPYLDSRKHWHIGTGLLLKLNDSNCYEKLAIDAFKFIDKDLYSFIPIENLSTKTAKNYKLTKSENEKLLLYVLKQNEKKIISKISFYNNLPLNQKIAIQSMYYNAPSLLGKNFINNLINYHEKKDKNFLINCIYEIEQNSNSKRNSDWFGIQKRRYFEGLMFSDNYIDLLIRVPFHLQSDFKKNFLKCNESFEDYQRFIFDAKLPKENIPNLQKICDYLKTVKIK